MRLRVPRSRVLLSDYDAWEIGVYRQEPLTYSDRQRKNIERRIKDPVDPRVILGLTWTRMFDLHHKPFATSAGTFRCARVQVRSRDQARRCCLRPTRPTRRT